MGSSKDPRWRERGYSVESPGIQQGPRVEGKRVCSCIPLGSSKDPEWRERGYSVESPWDPAKTQGGGKEGIQLNLRDPARTQGGGKEDIQLNPLGSSKDPGWRKRGYAVESPWDPARTQGGGKEDIQLNPLGSSKDPGWRERGYAVASPWDPARTQGGGKEDIQLNPPGIQQGPRVEGKRVCSCIPLGSSKDPEWRERGYSVESPWDPARTQGGGKEGMQLHPTGIQQGPRVEGKRIFS